MPIVRPPNPPFRRSAAPSHSPGASVAQCRRAADLPAPALRGPAAEQLLPAHGGGFRVRAGDSIPRSPTGTYNFVQVHGTTPSSHPVFVSAQMTHAQLAQGRPVVYAGTAKFEKGRMQWWSNYSGTYQPLAAFRGQASLPGEKFVPWQQLQLGGHAMQRTMLGERKSSGPPQTRPPAPARAATATARGYAPGLARPAATGGGPGSGATAPAATPGPTAGRSATTLAPAATAGRASVRPAAAPRGAGNGAKG